MNLKNYIVPITTALAISVSTFIFTLYIAVIGVSLDGIATKYLLSVPLQFIGAMLLVRGKYRGLRQHSVALSIIGVGSLVGFASIKAFLI